MNNLVVKYHSIVVLILSLFFFENHASAIHSIHVIDSYYPELTNGEYVVDGEYNAYPVYTLNNNHVYRRQNGQWFIDLNEVSEDWDGTIAWSIEASETPWTQGYSKGAISLVNKIYVSESLYPENTTGWYSLTASYNGFPVYQFNGHSVYRRSNGQWFLDFNEVSEDWEGTLAWSVGVENVPWDNTYSNGKITIDNSNPELPQAPFDYEPQNLHHQTIIDALILLTPDAKQEIGAKGQTPSEYLNWRIDALNDTLNRSLITSSQIRLVGIHELSNEDFERTGQYPNGPLSNHAAALDWLSTYRDSYGADKVLMIGASSEPNNDKVYGSGDVSSYFVDFLPIEHEVGHTMGGSHCSNGQAGQLNFGMPIAGYDVSGNSIPGDSGGTRMCGDNVAFYSNPDIELSSTQITALVNQNLMPDVDYTPYLNAQGKLKMGDENYANMAYVWRNNEESAARQRVERMYSSGADVAYSKDNCVGLFSGEGYQGFIKEVCVGEELIAQSYLTIASIQVGKNVHTNLYSDDNFGAASFCGGTILRSAFSIPSLQTLSDAENMSVLKNNIGSINVYFPSDRNAHSKFNLPYIMKGSIAFPPQCIGDTEQIIQLLPDSVAGSAASALNKTSTNRSFTLSFKVKSSHLSANQHGEGFTFFFAKNPQSYDNPQLIWNHLGFEKDGTGYAIRFHDVLNEIALIDGDHNVIGSTSPHDAYTNGEWVTIKIKVNRKRVKVFWDEVLVHQVSHKFDATYKHFGFGAGTGQYTSEFLIKDVMFM